MQISPAFVFPSWRRSHGDAPPAFPEVQGPSDPPHLLNAPPRCGAPVYIPGAVCEPTRCAATFSRGSTRVWLLFCLPTVGRADLLPAATGLRETHFKALFVGAQIGRQRQIAFSPQGAAAAAAAR